MYIFARVLGFELTIHFEYITGSGQSTSGCDHFVPFERTSQIAGPPWADSPPPRQQAIMRIDERCEDI
ncbi:hypothetical protein AOQ72_16165 [Bradyrhizobium yuanmingense]|uniref:Uncharacterized protein n=1 Tax=Bradyrhizobium yuanmingense TaxID=108015 RepID=A0A0R3CMA3_9BRAD|nr:hypothetical protein AOQ72_16165 [Bradyrhizobium yuanmingense]